MTRARSEAVEGRKAEAIIEAGAVVGVHTDVAVGAVSDRRRELDAVSALLQAGGSCASDVKNYSNCLNIQIVRTQRNSAK